MDDSTPAIEQAVISIKLGPNERGTRQTERVSLTRTTPGALADDVDELLNWASRVELIGSQIESTNLFFFPLPSGAFAIGRLTPNQGRFANEGEFYFQTMIAPEPVFLQCGANPVALYREAINTTRFGLYQRGAKLKPFSLDVKLCCVDGSEVSRGVAKVGARALSRLTQSILESDRTSFVVGAKYRAFLVVSDLFTLTPICWRPELTFSVGVSFGADAPLRLFGSTVRANETVDEARATPPFFDLRDVEKDESAYPLDNGWAEFVELALRSKRLSSFYCRLAEDFVERRAVERAPRADEIAERGFEQKRRLEQEIQSGDEDICEIAANLGFERDDEAEEESPAVWEGGWRDSDDDERDWGFGNDDICRLDAGEVDEENGEDEERERGTVEFIDDLSNETTRGDKNAGDDSAPTLSLETLNLLQRARDAEIDEARRANENDANDDSSEQERETNDLDALKRYFDETKNQLRHTLTPKKTAKDDEPTVELERSSAFEPSSRSSAGAPFDVLVEEYPDDEAILRELETSTTGACAGSDAKLSELRERWRAFYGVASVQKLFRAREEILRFLNERLTELDERPTAERLRTSRSLSAVFDVVLLPPSD